jgi:hypothetical protein
MSAKTASYSVSDMGSPPILLPPQPVDPTPPFGTEYPGGVYI